MSQEPEHHEGPGKGDPQASAPAPRRVRRTILYLAVLAAAVLAAWQVHLFRESRRRPGPLSMEPYKPDPVESPSESWANMTPSEWASRPWGGAGVRKMLKTPPADLPRIPGARFRRGIERVQDGYAYRHGSYSYEGAVDAAAAKYAQTLKDMGFELLRDAPSRTDRSARTLTFSSGAERIVVSLRPAGGKNGIINVGVTASRRVR